MNPNSFNQHHQGSHPGSSSQQGGHPGQGPGPGGGGGGQGGQGMSPAMLNAFQKQQQMGVNPAQLMGMGGMGGMGGMPSGIGGMGGMGGGMGGMGGGMGNISGLGGGLGGMGGMNMANIGGMNNMGMNLSNMGMAGINPSQLMSSSSSSSIQGDHHGHPGLQQQHSGGSMGAGINPAALSGSVSAGGAGSMQRGGTDASLLPSFPHIPHVVPPNHAGQLGMNPGSGSGPQPGQGGSGGGGQISIPAALNAMGIPRERFMAMSNEQKQAVMSRYMSMLNHQRSGGGGGGGGGGNPNQMMGPGGGMNPGMGGGGNMGGGGGMGDMMGMGGNMMGGMSGMGGLGNMSNMGMGMMNGMGGMSGGMGGGGNIGGMGGGMGNLNMGNMGGMGNIALGNMSNPGGMGFDRPSSAASSHSNNAQSQQSNQQGQPQQGQGQQGSRMPPPPLPSNAAGIQRPGTVPPGTPSMGNIQLGLPQQSQSQGQQGQGGHGQQGHPGQQNHQGQGQQGHSGQQGQGGQQGQQISRPGTSLSHRSPVIPGPSGGNIPGMERPGSRMAQRQDMNGFNHQAQQQQQQAQSQSRSASRAGSLAPQGQGQNQSGSGTPSNQGGQGHGQGNAPGPSTSPPVSAGGGQQGQNQQQQNPMMSPYRGAKRKLPGEGPSSAGPGNMQGGGGMNMGQMGQMNMNMMGNMGMGPMGMSGMMGGGGGGGGGVPGSPRIGPQSHGGPQQTPSGLQQQQGQAQSQQQQQHQQHQHQQQQHQQHQHQLHQQGMQGGTITLNPVAQGQMGPPILPRSISGDGMPMNGARGSPRPGSSMGFRQGSMGPMGMQGMGGMGGGGGGGGGGGMGGMGGIPSGAVSGGMGMPGSGGASAPTAPHVVPIQPAPSISTPGTPGPGMGMGGGMNMGGAGPQTPLRHGSLPPGASPGGTPLGMVHPLAQGGSQLGGPGGVVRQGSLPPHGMMSPAGVRGPMGMGMGMGGGPAMPGSPAPGGMPGGVGGMSGGVGGMPGAGLGGPMALGSSLSTGNIAPGITSGGTPAPVAPGALGTSASVGPPGSQGGGTPGPGAQSAIPGAQSAASANLPPLPAGVNLNPQTTQITPVPLLTSEKVIPPLSETEISAIQEWMAVDKAYLQKVSEMQNRTLKEVRGPSNPLVGGFWWEKGGVGSNPNYVKWGRAPGPFSVALPGTWREKRKRRKVREGLKLPRAIGREDAERVEQLVPVRIEFDVEHHKMRDTFVWNLSDPVVTPEIFAQSIVDDYGLAPSYHSVIVKSIQEQLSDYKSHSGLYDVDHDLQASGGVIRGKLDEEEARWWETWRKSVKVESTRAAREYAEVVANGKDDDGADSEAPASAAQKTSSRRRLGGGLKRKKKTGVKVEDEDGDVSMLGDNEDEGEDERENDRVVSFDVDDESKERLGGMGDVIAEMKPMGLDEFKYDETNMHEDMRILIKLDIIVAAIKLDDQFEWDLDNPYASPEGFAEVYAQELGLSGEFKTAIAHSIREQVQAYQKSLFIVGHPSDGSAIQDEELKQSFLPSLISGARPLQEVDSFTPVLYQPSDAELERTEKERDKDLIKRRKRNTRGRRGIALPDREPIRTYRTPAIGFPELDAATLALAAAANAPVSRRAAAAAASLTIANMVASENGERAFIPQSMPSQAAQPAPASTPAKEKKPKGLFKAPPFPQSVLRPRAHVRAPTESTAADVSKMPTVPADSEAPMSSSPINTSLHDQRALKVMTAKRAKELEREAKEKEFVDGQHPNYIKGVWHCSNCGCPENIAIGRRKGPLGDKSQCGTCGKFWHRHRRPRPVEYNPDPDFHSGLKQKEIEAKTPLSKKKSAAAALRAQSTAISTPAADSEPQTPVRSNGGDIEFSRKSPTPAGDDRAMSPVSTSSSASEAPLAQKVKLNGSHSKTNSAPVSTPAKTQPPPDTPVSSSKPAPEVSHTSESAPPPASTAPISAPAPASASAPPSGSISAGSPNRPPPWLSAAMAAMMSKYHNDKFEVILRRIQPSSPPEWRLKCSDCPGKVYKPGPGETLSNFEVHLKNRQHRQSVNERVHGTAGTGTPPATTASAAAPSSEQPAS